MTTVSSEAKTRDLANADGELSEPPWPLRLALQLVNELLAASYRLIRPLAPQFVPLAVFVITIPVLIFFSISAGLLVWRSIAVGWESNLDLQYGDGAPPYAQVMLPPLVSQQPYDISLHLVVPQSRSNYDLGNFMATLTLVTPTNRTIVSVRKSALVLPPSTSLMSYFWEQPGTVHLTVPLISSIETGTSTVIANVELGRRDQWKSIGSGEGRELSVSAAFLRGVVVHQGLRGLLTRFPLATALSASGTFLFISCLILASCLLPMIELRLPDETETIEAAQTETPPSAPKREESSSRRGRRSRSSTVPRRRSRSLSQIKPEDVSAEDIKPEETSTSIPPASSSPTPLRRRRSRPSPRPDPDH